MPKWKKTKTKTKKHAKRKKPNNESCNASLVSPLSTLNKFYSSYALAVDVKLLEWNELKGHTYLKKPATEAATSLDPLLEPFIMSIQQWRQKLPGFGPFLLLWTCFWLLLHKQWPLLVNKYLFEVNRKHLRIKSVDVAVVSLFFTLSKYLQIRLLH